MNALQTYIQSNGLSENEVLNLLQDRGVISDLAVRAQDVDVYDCPKAVAWLDQNPALPR